MWLLTACATALLILSLAAFRGRQRRWNLALAAGGVICAGANLLPDIIAAAGQSDRTPCTRPSVSIYTQNIWNHNPDPDTTAASIRMLYPDIVLLQEIQGPAKRTFASLKDVYPYGFDCVDNRWCGLAILSKFPIRSSEHHQGRWRPPEYDRLTYIAATIDLGASGGDLPVLTAHLSHPGRWGAQRNQVASLIRHLDSLGGERAILAGDLNATPTMYAIRTLDRGLRMRRLTHVLKPTWPAWLGSARWQSPVPLPFMPIDQVYVGNRWKACDLRLAPRNPSDHYGVLLTITPAEGAQ